MTQPSRSERELLPEAFSFLVAPDETPLRELLKRFTYRPGWKFYVNAGMLFIEAEVIDANDPSRTAPLHFSHSIPAQLHDGFPWQRWLFDMILQVEMHEAREFFQIDGAKPFDPHADD